MGAPQPYFFTPNLKNGAPELYIFTLNLEMEAPEPYIITLNMESVALSYTFYAKFGNGCPWAIYFYVNF